MTDLPDLQGLDPDILTSVRRYLPLREAYQLTRQRVSHRPLHPILPSDYTEEEYVGLSLDLKKKWLLDIDVPIITKLRDINGLRQEVRYLEGLVQVRANLQEDLLADYDPEEPPNYYGQVIANYHFSSNRLLGGWFSTRPLAGKDEIQFDETINNGQLVVTNDQGTTTLQLDQANRLDDVLVGEDGALTRFFHGMVTCTAIAIGRTLNYQLADWGMVHFQPLDNMDVIVNLWNLLEFRFSTTPLIANRGRPVISFQAGNLTFYLKARSLLKKEAKVARVGRGSVWYTGSLPSTAKPGEIYDNGQLIGRVLQSKLAIEAVPGHYACQLVSRQFFLYDILLSILKAMVDDYQIEEPDLYLCPWQQLVEEATDN